jgi:hypothetical protein
MPMNRKTAAHVLTCSAIAVLGAGVYVMTPIMPRATLAAPLAEDDVMRLVGVVRDFKERTLANGHPDFEITPVGGFGLYANNIKTTLDTDGKPVFVGGGKQLVTQYRDASGRNICPSLFDASKGDVAGVMGVASTGVIESAASFH